MKPFHGCLIGGTHSGAGKTTWALALMRFAQKKGMCVQPFKAGPDYIDTAFHHQACRPRKSRNLDLFLLSEEKVRKSFAQNCADADLGLVEGVMGLFDGKKATEENSSSAHLAKILGLPVFLVIDGAGMATSAAAIAKGFKEFDSQVNLAGVLLNKVNSPRHFAWLKEAIEKYAGVSCLGYLPKEESLHIPERHLGLTTALETKGLDENIERAAAILESNLDWPRFLELSKINRPLTVGPLVVSDSPVSCRIGVAYDRAFSFYYEDNFDLLKKQGAELVFFSPLEDAHLPQGLDLLYLGGGFPEIYAAGLAANHSMIQEIRNFHAAGGFIYAECGGLIYLAEAFIDKNQNEYPFAGLVPGKIRMTERLQNFGYHEFEIASDSFLGLKGQKLRSHEFHYSAWDSEGKVEPAFLIGDRKEGFSGDRILATYQHLHFGHDPMLAAKLAGCGGKTVQA